MTTTADYIAFHATERPDAVALVHQGRGITFATWSLDLLKLTRAVANLEVRPGGAVAVGADDLYTHWLLLLAFERLGIATTSFLSVETKASVQLLADVDLVLSEPHFPAVGARRHHAITAEWLAQALALEPEDDEPALPCSAGDPLRILRTSGTTGSPKRIAHWRALHDAWAMGWIVMMGLGRHTRLLLTMSFSVNGMYACATACLRTGGTVVAADMRNARDLVRAIADHRINAVILVPFQLGQVLDALPPGFEKPPDLAIYSFGAAVSSVLRRRALDHLATELLDIYGTNETGVIAWIGASRDDGSGTLWPGVRVEIVDDRDIALPRGQIGRIRAQTPHMVQAYLGDPEATRRMFRDGWFYPGDLGILHGPGRLQILGRGDDLLNFGGRKIPAETLEQAIMKRVTLGDVAVCSIPNAAGIEALFVGVTDVGDDDRELLHRLNDALGPFQLGQFYVVKLPRIPRNANGKIQRDLLKRAVVGATAKLLAQ